tara:strand:+ start:184 stop:1218 length:1035 start_codon:yes stop_codon:yes gene_type:complete
VAQENSILQHRLYIDGEEVLHETKGTVSFNGNNQLNSLSVQISNPDLQNQSLNLKPVKFYLDNKDSVPLFSGIVRDFTPTSSGIGLKCVDVRGWISGANGYQVILTDKDNYDGYSISGFLYSFILEKVNDKKTLIGLDRLNGITPPVKESFLSNERTGGAVYDVAATLIKKVIDIDTDFMNPLGYFFDIIEEHDISHLVIKKDKLLTETPSIIYSYADGLINYKYKNRATPNTAAYEGGEFTYTSASDGKTIRKVIPKVEGKSRAELRNLGIKQILLENQSKDEITIQVAHGHYIGLGSIVRLNVEEENIKGNHRVVGKNITFGDSMTCTLKLGKAPPQLSEYL